MCLMTWEPLTPALSATARASSKPASWSPMEGSPRMSARAAGGPGDRVHQPGGARGQLYVLLDRLVQRLVRRDDPRQDGRGDPRGPQLQGLADVGGAQAVGPALHAGPRAGDQPMPVGVG